MNLWLKEVRMSNIQSHRDTKILFRENGMVFFNGDNSYGKSVFDKTMMEVLNGNIKKPRKRRTLISRGKQYGEMLLIRDDDVELLIHIAQDSASTYLELKQQNEQTLRRYLSDKSVNQLCTIFGWHYDEYTGVSLNICDEYGIGLFFQTTPKQNFSVASSAIRDNRAEQSLETLEKLYKDNVSLHKKMCQAYQSDKAAKDTIKVWNIEEQSNRKKLLMRYLRVLNAVNMPPFPTLVYPVKAAAIDVIPFPVITYPTIVDLSLEMPDVKKLLGEIEELMTGVCPTCGRGWVDEERSS